MTLDCSKIEFVYEQENKKVNTLRQQSTYDHVLDIELFSFNRKRIINLHIPIPKNTLYELCFAFLSLLYLKLLHRQTVN